MNTFRHEVRPLTVLDFDQVREMARTSCGISLPEGKKAMVSSRLEQLVRRHGFGSFTEYIRFVSERRHCHEFIEFIDTLTTNHSGFWREPEHFTFLQKSVFGDRRQRIRIWSSACATGEEPYNISMCALEAGIPNCQIAASDISRAALTIAVRGEYDQAKVAALPPGWRERYFNHSRLVSGGLCTVAAHVRAPVNFAPLNLLQPFGHLGQFDVIFCRNVMIYFEQATRDDLIDRLAAQLPGGGYLFTGHSESLLRLPANLQYIQPAVYRKI